MKVLIVDPDWRFARRACRFLEWHAHLVVHQTDPDLAVQHAEHWKPDLVIAAAELAEGDLLASLRNLQPRPAVLLTGWLDRCDRLWRVWQKGGDELLIKPVLKSQELHLAIVTALENAAAGVRHAPARAAG